WLRAWRDARAPLPFEERPGLVIPAHFARQVDRVQVPLAVRLQRKERERGREPVRDSGLDGDRRSQLAEDGVEIDAFRVADRTEGVAGAALDDCLVVLAPLLEQVVHQPACPHLALVALEHVSAAEEAR